MILVLDAGNTNIVLGCMDKGAVLSEARMETSARKTEHEYAVSITQILGLEGIKPGDFSGAVVSSVVPPLTEVLKRAVTKVTGIEPLVIGPGVKTGLHIGLDDPGTIGADLVAAAVAALREYPMPCVVIDMGTATTLSVMDGNGKLLGGAIMAGPAVTMNALAGVTAQLPHISMEPPRKAISSNTVDCMKSGAVFGCAASIDGMLARFEAELGCPVCAVATGGLAGRVIPFCTHEVTIDDDLLLKGLWYIWEKNRRVK